MTVRRGALLALLLASGVAVAALAGGASAHSHRASVDHIFVVDSTADLPDANVDDGVCRASDGHCTLRAAAMGATRYWPDTAEIDLGDGTYDLTIPAAGSDFYGANGALKFAIGFSATATQFVTIVGRGADRTIVHQTVPDTRVFDAEHANLTLSSLTVRGGHVAPTARAADGRADSTGGAVHAIGGGTVVLDHAVIESNGSGAIETRGTNLQLLTSVVRNNDGHGILASRDVSITASTVSGNTGTGILWGCLSSRPDDCAGSSSLTISRSTIADNAQGGVFAAFGGGTATIADTTIRGNVSTTPGAEGAGITARLVGGTLAVERSTIASNTSGVYHGAGGIWTNASTHAPSQVSIVNSTISGNSGYVGGVSVGGDPSPTDTEHVTEVTGSTLALNTGTVADGVYNHIGVDLTTDTDGAVRLTGTAMANPGADRNCVEIPGRFERVSAGFESGGGNVDEGSTCYFVFAVPVDPSDRRSADPLLQPLADNGGYTQTHALATGSPAIDNWRIGCPAFDQRSYLRPAGAACDAGAYERDAHGLPPFLAPPHVLWDLVHGVLVFTSTVHPLSAHVSIRPCAPTRAKGTQLRLPIVAGLLGGGRALLATRGGIILQHGKQHVELCNWAVRGSGPNVGVDALRAPGKKPLPLFSLGSPRNGKTALSGTARLTPRAAQLLDRLLGTKLFRPGMSFGAIRATVQLGPAPAPLPPAPPTPPTTTTTPPPTTTATTTTTTTTTTTGTTTTATTQTLPDLVVSDLQAFSATVKNQGNGSAAASVLRIAGVGDFKIGALAPGATQSVNWTTCVAPVQATADVLAQVAESNESNNSRKYDTLC
jgi:hypothetical protein